jgi:sugar phosphate isomerase/epimerase
MTVPKLACCNFLTPTRVLKEFALDHGFDGVDWTIHLDDFSDSTAAERDLIAAVRMLRPLEVRFHYFFEGLEVGDRDVHAANRARQVFRRVCNLIQRAGGRVMTLHVGLGRETTAGVCWDSTVAGLRNLAEHARAKGIRVCLENLAWEWTGRPALYEKLIRKTGCWATLDIGHAAVCGSIASHQFAIEDFISPHPERIINAHVYHLETELGHTPPDDPTDLHQRLDLLLSLPMCDWWVLELREEQDLLKALHAVRDYLSLNAVFPKSGHAFV